MLKQTFIDPSNNFVVPCEVVYFSHTFIHIFIFRCLGAEAVSLYKAE